MSDSKRPVSDQTRRFLEQMERRRLARPCLKAVDMRGKVPSECRPFLHGDFTHHFDDISLAIFKRGLELSGGIFTVGTYEAIVNGPHTNRALRQKVNAHPAASEAAAMRTGPQIISFSYFSKRREERVQYATPVLLVHQGHDYHGSSVNLSVHGVQVHLRGHYPFRVDEIMNLQMPELFGDEAPPLPPLPYRVRHVAQNGVDFYVHLSVQPDALDAEAKQRLATFIHNYRARNKLDISDEVLDVIGRLHERILCENLPTLALYIGLDAGGAPKLVATATPNGNPPLASLFAHGGAQDYSALGLRPHLEQLLQQGELLLAVRHLDDGTPQATAPLPEAAALCNALREPGTRLLRLVLAPQPMHEPTVRRLYGHTGPALEPSSWEEHFSGILTGVTAVAMAYDQTALANCHCPQAGATATTLPWRNGDDKPTVVDFRRLRSRRAPRYRANTRVVATIGTDKYNGHTIDISIHGLALQMDRRVALEEGADVLIGFPVMQEKRPQLGLMRIPFRVVRSLYNGKGTHVTLRRLLDKCSDGVNGFFRDLIEQNIDRMTLDEEAPQEIVATHAYEALLAENLAALPFFFGREKERGLVVHSVAVADDNPGPLANFFLHPEGGFDFSALFTSEFRLALSERFRTLLRDSSVYQHRAAPAEFDMLCYREGDDAHCLLLSEMGVENRSEWRTRLQALPDHLFIKVIAAQALSPEIRILERTVHAMHRLSTYHAINLDEQVRAIEGCGLLINMGRTLPPL